MPITMYTSKFHRIATVYDRLQEHECAALDLWSSQHPNMWEIYHSIFCVWIVQLMALSISSGECSFYPEITFNSSLIGNLQILNVVACVLAYW
jgi:hypothetical protein